MVSAFSTSLGRGSSDIDLDLYAHHCVESCAEWSRSTFRHRLKPKTRQSLDVCLDQESDGGEPAGLPLFIGPLLSILAVPALGRAYSLSTMALFSKGL